MTRVDAFKLVVALGLAVSLVVIEAASPKVQISVTELSEADRQVRLGDVVTVEGRTEPGYHMKIYVDSELSHEFTVAGTGRFTAYVQLAEEGPRRILLRAYDHFGREAATSPLVDVNVTLPSYPIQRIKPS